MTSQGAPAADKEAADMASTSAGTQTEERDPYSEFFEDFAPSVVTVAYDVNDNKATEYGTGFILLSERKYTAIYASNRRLERRHNHKRKYYIYFEAEAKIEAEVLEYSEFLILLVRDDKVRQPVRFSVDPVGYEEITTIGAMGGAKMHVNTPVIHTLIGVLGNYRGDVTTKSCAARDSQGIELEGSERYFRVGCFALDQIVTVQNVDVKENQTAYRIVSAPVFRLTTGEMVGIIYSTSDWCDIKMGLHAQDILAGLVDLFGSHYPKITTWEEGLKKRAEKIM